MTATPRSVELRLIAQGIADALPVTAEEVVLTGSVSRGVADDVSDIEMLIVTRSELGLEDCFSLAAACGLTELGTWGVQGVPTKRVSGYREGRGTQTQAGSGEAISTLQGEPAARLVRG